MSILNLFLETILVILYSVWLYHMNNNFRFRFINIIILKDCYQPVIQKFVTIPSLSKSNFGLS